MERHRHFGFDDFGGVAATYDGIDFGVQVELKSLAVMRGTDKEARAAGGAVFMVEGVAQLRCHGNFRNARQIAIGAVSILFSASHDVALGSSVIGYQI